MNNCLELLLSECCKDRLFIIFVIAEYFRYLAALLSDSCVPNNSFISKEFKFGKTLFLYRNAFAHSENVIVLDALCADLVKARESICSYFSGDVYLKVYDALTN